VINNAIEICISAFYFVSLRRKSFRIMTNEELDKWFDNLSYVDKCAAIHCIADDTYSVKELKKMYTPEEMLEVTYLRRTFEPNHWYDSDLEDKQYVYDFFKK